MQTTVDGVKSAIPALPVTEMSTNELEEELEVLELAYDIFKVTDPHPEISAALKEAIKKYGDRIRDIKGELFERLVLL